jgi:hypothetical protein
MNREYAIKILAQIELKLSDIDSDLAIFELAPLVEEIATDARQELVKFERDYVGRIKSLIKGVK